MRLRYTCSASRSISSKPAYSGSPLSQARQVCESYSLSNISPHLGHLVITAGVSHATMTIRLAMRTAFPMRTRFSRPK